MVNPDRISSNDALSNWVEQDVKFALTLLPKQLFLGEKEGQPFHTQQRS